MRTATTIIGLAALLATVACSGDTSSGETAAADDTPTEEEGTDSSTADSSSDADGEAGAPAGYLAEADADFGSGGVLEIQLDYDTAEAGGLDPMLADTARSWMLFDLVYETLTTVDADMAVQPGLAESWDMPDDTTYVFTLRDDAVFSNGRAVTADDVAGSLRRIGEVGSTWTPQLGPVSSIEATGDLEVTVTLDAPHTPFLAALATSQAGVMPIAEIEAGEVDPATDLLGSGLLVATDHRQDEFWSFEPNPHHPLADELGFSSVEMEIVAEEATRLAALRDGSADLAVLNSVDAPDLLSGTDEAAVVSQTNTDFYYLMINSRREGSPITDEAVRFAVNSAIDRAQLIDIAFAGQSAPTGVTPAVLPDACDPAALPSAQATPEDISSALADAGAEDLSLSLLIYDDPTQAQMAQIMQQQLAGHGITIEIEQMDYVSYSALVYEPDPADFDLAMSWFAGYADPSMVTGWWNPTQAVFSSVFMEDDPDVNALIAEGRATPPGDERAATFTDLCAAVDENAEMVPLLSRSTILGFRTDQLSPSFYAAEGYGNFLRLLTEFRAAP
ncbi:MAG: ABC transporter substrate-binding protein [Actinomycetota bacterium]|nr:ABC transporter substrate-binding protein [Actinomycetota bacterium]